MNTPAHMIIGAAAFARAGKPRVSWAAILGGLTPDLSLYFMTFWAMNVRDIPAETVFGQLYFSDAWQSVFAIDNSFVLWGLLWVIAYRFRRPALTAFAGAGVLHLCCDFPLHNEDARRQFWPLSDWVFRSPFSYYDPNHYGNIIGPLEMLLCLGLSILLWRRFQGWRGRALIALGLSAEVLPGLIFQFMFHG